MDTFHNCWRTLMVLLLCGLLTGAAKAGDDAGDTHLLLPAGTLARLRSEAAADTPRWHEFKSALDGNLTEVLSRDSYQASDLVWISNYALGYQVLKESDPASAGVYADKAIALIKSALHDYKRGVGDARQFLGRGDGSATTFALPNADVVPASLKVYLGSINTQAIHRSPTESADAVAYYSAFIAVSDKPDGQGDYKQGVDWWRNGEIGNNLLDWSLPGRKPASNAVYYVASASYGEANLAAYELQGGRIHFAVAPTTDQAIFVEYVYGKHSADGSTLAYQQTSAGDGGFNSIFIDTGYTARSLGKHVAMGLDWLDGYPGFSPELKKQVMDMLLAWSQYVRDHGYYKGSPASNYEAGNYVSRVMTALALAKRHDAGPALIKEIVAYRRETVVKLLTGPPPSLRGGFWAEGWNYGQLATQNLLLGGLALEESGATADAAAERQWAGEVIRHLVSAQSSPGSIYDGGDWYHYPAPFPSKTLISILQSSASDASAQAYANYILQKFPGKIEPDYLDLIFGNASPGKAAYWDDLPLQYLAEGTGLLTMRSDWGENPTWVAAFMGNLLGADHQCYTPGQLQIRRAADDLLINGNSPGGHQGHPSTYSTYGNVILVDDGGDGAQVYRWGMGLWYGSPGVQILSYQPEKDFVYLGGDYRAAYSLNTAPGEGGPAKELTRQIVYARPDCIFVYDRVTTTKPAYAKQQRWHFLNAPTLAGNAFKATSGQSTLFASTFASVPIATTEAAVKVGDAVVHQVITQNVKPTETVHYATAFQVAASTVPEMMPTRYVKADGDAMEGIQLGSTLVLFGPAGQVPTATVLKYDTAGPGAIRHILVNLIPNRRYRLKAGDNVEREISASANGVLSFTTEQAGTATVEIVEKPN